MLEFVYKRGIVGESYYLNADLIFTDSGNILSCNNLFGEDVVEKTFKKLEHF